MNAISTYESTVSGDLGDLNSFEFINAERRIHAGGSEPRQRATIFASVLGVEADRLARYVGSLLRRVPAENRSHHQDDLEQSIWAHLYHRREHARGNWELVKLVVRDAYTQWYTAYAEERQLAVEAVNRSISLERAYARDHQERPEGVGHDVKDNGWVGWETAIDGNVDGYRIMSMLPKHIQDLVERKANGTPINRAERTRLQRFLAGGPTKRNPGVPTNKELIASALNERIQDHIEWSKPQR